MEIPDDSEFCPFCGDEVKFICNSCGTELEPNFLYCKKCGKKINDKKDLKKKKVYKCPHCSTEIKPESIFCKICGKKVND